MIELPLLKHQLGDIEWIHHAERGLLGNEPGLGKSRSAIEAFDGGHNLVIAPNLVVAGGTWDDELEKWSADPSKWTIATFSILNERTRTGKGSGTRPEKRLREPLRGSWDAVVVDEAHYIKGRDTSWTWATEQITKCSDSVLLMTGTPIPNWAHELFTLLRIIYPKQAHPGKDFGSFWRWAGTWFDTSPSPYSNGKPSIGEMLNCDPSCSNRPAWEPCVHYRDFAEQNLGGQFRRILREDALDLPPLTRTTVRVPLDTATRKAYTALKKDFFARLEDGTIVSSWSQGSLNMMLQRVTTSPWFLNPVGKPRGGKLERLKFDLQARSRPTVVFAHFQDSVEACAAVSRDLGLRTGYVHGGVPRRSQGEAIRAFKRGALDVLVGSLETLSESFTFTQADMAILVEMSFKPSRNEQARRRIHRIGQDRPVTILEYVTPNTVDSNKMKLLETKTDHQMRVLTAAQFGELL